MSSDRPFSIAELRRVLRKPGPSAPPTSAPVGPVVAGRLSAQNQAVLDMLLAGRRLTAASVFNAGIHRLAARVYELRRAGYAVKSRVLSAGVSEYWMEAT